MKVGIIVHSHTGNTLSVAERLREELASKGHSVKLERVAAVNEDPSPSEKIILKTVPDITEYDAIIFAAPVRGFNLSPVMSVYLSQLPDLSRKKLACFVTEHFPKAWMGGNQANKKMMRLIAQKGGKVEDTGVINWSGKAREQQINDVLASLCKIV